MTHAPTPTMLGEDGDWTAALVAGAVAQLLDGATIVGAVPDFDTRHLTRFLRNNGQAPTWHYHLVDVETLAAGRLGMAPPWNFDTILEAFGLTYDEADRHTALGDTRTWSGTFSMRCSGTPPTRPWRAPMTY